MPHGKERQAQNVPPLGAGESEASWTLTQEPLTVSSKAEWPALDYSRHHLFPTTHSMPLGKPLTLWIGHQTHPLAAEVSCCLFESLPPGRKEFFCLFVWFVLFFETGFLCVVLELTL